MEEITEKYKGFTIKIEQDLDPSNPFEDWDCEPSLMVEGNNYNKDYSDGEIDSFLTNYLTDNQIVRHKAKILKLINYHESFDSDHEDYTAKEKIDILRDELSDFLSEDIENKVSFCNSFNIIYYSGTSRGYSQGSWADVFVIITDKDREKLGIDKKNDAKVCEQTFKLYGYWAWGDVWGYIIQNKDDEELDSCWGYYGDYPEYGGIIDATKHIIDAHLEYEASKNIDIATYLLEVA